MPKKIEPEEDEEFDEDQFEEDEEPIVKGRGRPPMKKELPKSYRAEEEEPEEEAELDDKPLRQKMMVKKPIAKPSRDRYVAFAYPNRIGIADAETNEVIAEGDYALLQVLAKILGKLEMIENQIGSFT